jgi:glycosyltransferase involved in cell wall biosynthesis
MSSDGARGPTAEGSALAGQRILLVSHFASEVRGSRRACTATLERSVRAIVGAGGEAFVAPIRAESREREQAWAEGLGGKLLWVPLWPRYNPFYVARLARAIDDVRPSLVHAHFIPADLYGGLAALRARCKPTVLVTAHNLFHTLRTWRVFLPLYRSMRRRGVHYAGVSKAVTESIAGPLGLPVDAIEVLLNPREPLAPITAEERAQAKAACGLGPGTTVVGSFGRVIYQKGLDTLFPAFAQFASTRPDSALIIAGDGDQVPALRALATELGIAAKVRFLGAYTDVRAVAQAMDFAVMPSRWEGLPIAGTEAAMLGLPLVASDIEPMTELGARLGAEGWPLIVRDGSTDPAAIARGMAEVASSLERFRTSALEASRRAEDLFTNEATQRLVGLYRELLEGRPPTPTK